MDPAVQEYLKAILSTAQSGAAFVKEQAPLVVQELISYGRAIETIWFVLVVFITTPTIYFSIKRWDSLWKTTIEDDVPAIILPIVGLVASTVFLWNAIRDVTLVWFAPRLYVLEWAIGLTK